VSVVVDVVVVVVPLVDLDGDGDGDVADHVDAAARPRTPADT